VAIELGSTLVLHIKAEVEGQMSGTRAVRGERSDEADSGNEGRAHLASCSS
jgi:hypothetical protein